jgi:hypothetical protein
VEYQGAVAQKNVTVHQLTKYWFPDLQVQTVRMVLKESKEYKGLREWVADCNMSIISQPL